jgi:hypothetical protein
VFTVLLGGANCVVTEVVWNMRCILYGVRTTVHCCICRQLHVQGAD